MLKKWDDLPASMQNDSVRKYYDILGKKRFSLLAKRIFDIVTAFIMLIILSPAFLVLSIIIKADSRGPVFFRQTRVTQYGRHFRIFKFRTMVNDAEKKGSQITISNDERVTRAGRFLRKYRLDEIPQLINIIKGDMSFVGTRPEVVKYVEKYTDEMKATLLLPAGVTSSASIEYRNEEQILKTAVDVDEVYVNEVLPSKMAYNISDIENFSFSKDIKIMLLTVFAVIKNERYTVQPIIVKNESAKL